MGAETVCQLAYALDRLGPAFADDVRCAELTRERDSVGMAAHDDELLGAETRRGDHAAQANGAVADDGDGLAGADLRGDGRVVACAHHVREGEERWHQRVVLLDRKDDERPIRLWGAHRLGLRTVDLVCAEEPAVDARRLQSLVAELARSVRERERHHDEITDFQGADVGADRVDDADRLVAHHAAGLAVLQRSVGPEVAAADAGAVAGTDQLDRAAPPLAEADAFGYPDRLAVWVRVPCGARARREVDAACADPRSVRGRSDRVEVDRSGKPVARSQAGLDAVTRDLHGSLLASLPRRRATLWVAAVRVTCLR